MAINKLKNLNIKISPKTKNLIKLYIEEFLTYNAHTNLISKNDEKVLIEKHIFDSLAICKTTLLDNSKTLMDIGTGGGFPALPIALIYPKIKILGVDSIAKKIKFINNTAQKLNLKNITAIASRTENLDKELLESFDIITSRAVAPLNIILEYAAPFLKINGYFVAYKSKIAHEEIECAQNALKILNCEVESIVKYDLPLKENFERNLIIIKKIKKTPAQFPRKAGTAKANPL